MRKNMQHFKSNITEIPTYNDGIFFLYEISHKDNPFPTEYIEKINEDPFYYNERSLTDRILFENESRTKKITKKIRISQDKGITSKNVLEIDGEFYQVFNAFHFKNEDGYPETDITLQEYKSAIISKKENLDQWKKKNLKES